MIEIIRAVSREMNSGKGFLSPYKPSIKLHFSVRFDLPN